MCVWKYTSVSNWLLMRQLDKSDIVLPSPGRAKIQLISSLISKPLTFPLAYHFAFFLILCLTPRCTSHTICMPKPTNNQMCLLNNSCHDFAANLINTTIIKILLPEGKEIYINQQCIQSKSNLKLKFEWLQAIRCLLNHITPMYSIKFSKNKIH